jgi:hypothetical protein
MAVETYTTTNFALQKGGSFPEVTLVYSTLGTLAPKRDNVVLLPTWFSGDHAMCEAALIGPDRALDPGKYFIIIPNLIGPRSRRTERCGRFRRGSYSRSPARTCTSSPRRSAFIPKRRALTSSRKLFMTG